MLHSTYPYIHAYGKMARGMSTLLLRWLAVVLASGLVFYSLYAVVQKLEF